MRAMRRHTSIRAASAVRRPATGTLSTNSTMVHHMTASFAEAQGMEQSRVLRAEPAFTGSFGQRCGAVPKKAGAGFPCSGQLPIQATLHYSKTKFLGLLTFRRTF